jgi:hypothetical protein
MNSKNTKPLWQNENESEDSDVSLGDCKNNNKYDSGSKAKSELISAEELFSSCSTIPDFLNKNDKMFELKIKTRFFIFAFQSYIYLEI